MKKLIIHPEAASELEEAVVYHERRTEDLGRELRDEIERAFAACWLRRNFARRTGRRVFANASWLVFSTPSSSLICPKSSG